jgi:ribA/ribD-fused uncharacterized protein
MASSGSVNRLGYPIQVGRPGNPFPPSAAYYMSPDPGQRRTGFSGEHRENRARDSRWHDDKARDSRWHDDKARDSRWHVDQARDSVSHGTESHYITFLISEEARFGFGLKALEILDPTNNKLADELLQTGNFDEVMRVIRKTRDFDEDLLKVVQYDIMKEIVLEKYKRRPSLLSTGGTKNFVEATSDCFWGIGICMEDACAGVPWRGENQLGKIFMEVHDILQHTAFC